MKGGFDLDYWVSSGYISKKQTVLVYLSALVYEVV